MPKVAAYLRVSTASQNEAGQRREIQRWIEGNNIPAKSVTWYVDKKSGDNLNRPAFAALEAAIFSGEVNRVVVFKLDRLSRSLKDGIAVLCRWLESGVQVVSTSQQLDLSKTTGKMVASILLCLAEMEQECRRERQAIGIAVARERGVYHGRKPGTLKAKPSRAVRLKEKGFGIQEIASAMQVSRRTVCRYLASA